MAPVSLEILGRSSVRRVSRGKAKSFGRNSMATHIVAAQALCKAASCTYHQYFQGEKRSQSLRTLPNGQGTDPMNARCLEIRPLRECHGGRLLPPGAELLGPVGRLPTGPPDQGLL
jgi:hypothetical protein